MRKKLLLLSSILLGFVASAHAAVPTEISDMVTDAGTVWTSVKAVILSVVAFLILVSFVKKVKKT